MIKIKPIYDIQSLLGKKYGKNLKAGWLDDEKRLMPNWDKTRKLGSGKALKVKSIEGKKTIKDVIGYLEKQGRPVFSNPSNDKQKVKSVIEFIAKGAYDSETSIKKLINMAKAIFQKPMLKGDYNELKEGKYKARKESKGLFKPTILTGQTHDAISSKIEPSKRFK